MGRAFLPGWKLSQIPFQFSVKMRIHVLSKNAICTWVLTFSLLLWPACVATQQDVLVLHRQVRTLSKEIANMKADRGKQAEAVVELDSIRQEIQRLSGAQEENNHLIKHVIERDTSEQDSRNARLANLEKRVDRLYKSLNQDSQIKQITPKTSGYVAPPPPPTIAEKTQFPENSLYDATLTRYHEEKYQEAIAGFNGFLKTYPKSKLADNAQFWIGESYMALKKYDQAIVAFQDVIEKYPDGNKVPNAMLKQALAFYEIKDAISSRAILKRITKKYPHSPEAKLAEAKLKTIK